MSKFHNLHYRLIAARIRETREKIRTELDNETEVTTLAVTAIAGAEVALMELAFAFVESFIKDNDLFDVQVFLSSCTGGSSEWFKMWEVRYHG